MTRIACKAILLLFCAPVAFAQQSFKPPEVLSVADATVPYLVMPDGIFVLDVSLDASGAVTDIKPLRNPGAMLSAASAAVRMWKFRPAAKANASQASEITVVFVYRPPVYLASSPAFTPVEPYADSEPRDRPDYVPAGIAAVAYPEYPVNSVASGSVVVQVTVDQNGRNAGQQVVREQSPFTQFAANALHQWAFQPATLGGKPVTSKVVVAFVFLPPAPN